MKYTMEDVAVLARTCILLGKNERPELYWLKNRYDCIKSTYCLRNKNETDRFLYQRMYGQAPEKESEFLKIRYWRTGKYTPGNRKNCVLFGEALELSDKEMQFLLQWYCDRSMEVYDPAASYDEENYRGKKAYLQKIIDAYLGNIQKQRLASLRIPEKKIEIYFRHLYFTDALRYIEMPGEISADIINKHITSLRYESELARQMRLCGEIPRRVFIRHLLILGMPEITLDKLNYQLKFFGYLPLDEEHTMVRGERLDWLLIRLLQMYEEIREETDDHNSHLWFQEACRTLDSIFRQEGCSKLRFMHFKALNL